MIKVYISSTYEDLEEYRNAAARLLRKMNVRVVGMEDYVATDVRPLDKCLADVEDCDIYIGIFAWRYGYIPEQDNPERRSITELEYRHAEANKKTCLIFLLSKEVRWLPDWMDHSTGDGEKGKCIGTLRDELAKDKTVSFFRNSDELASLVGAAVSNWEKNQPSSIPVGRPARLHGVEERLKDLKDNIRDALKEIKRLESALLYEDDPEVRRDYRQSIERLRGSWNEYGVEHEALKLVVGTKSATTERATEGLREMDRKLRAISEHERQPGIGLALSGGGFRATLYHLGSLWRLNELGLLSRLSEISSVSAGSIVAGTLGVRWKDLQFDTEGVATNFGEVLADPIRKFCSVSIDTRSAILGLFNPFRTAGDMLTNNFRERLFRDATLQDLPDGPRFTLYATSFQTGASVRFSKPYLADYHLGVVWNPRIPLAQAVGASCAVPPLFGPITLKMDPDAWERTDGADLYRHERLRSELSLADGGLYDDMALERVWERYDTVLVSDAGLPFETSYTLPAQWARRATRTLEIVAHHSRSLRKRMLFEDFRDEKMKGAYWGIGTRLRDYGLEEQGANGPFASDSDLTRSLSKVRTRFNRFSEQEQGWLINWGYAVTDAAIRQFVLPSAAKPKEWPALQYPL